jgi:hypothetical protein
MLDPDTDAYDKIARAFAGGPPAGGLTRDHILDNITLYWLAGTGASAARLYWEAARAQAVAAGTTPPAVTLPVGFTVFPGEIFRAHGSGASSRLMLSGPFTAVSSTNPCARPTCLVTQRRPPVTRLPGWLAPWLPGQCFRARMAA